jgi:hypothetical protein
MFWQQLRMTVRNVAIAFVRQLNLGPKARALKTPGHRL